MDFSSELINWYHQNKRDLPWRNTTHPYKIWLSEIILQQTRVDQGLPYYRNFIENFPTINELANASEQEVLKLWQGLGYYSRARNLHTAAKSIINNHHGKFPEDYKAILSLKGIGEYTAAAIASFAYNQPYAVVDGNVYRVLARVYGIDTPIDSSEGKKSFKQLAQELIDKNNAATYNQAIMEFGALQCTPTNPNCTNCIFNTNCIAFTNSMINELPVKSNKLKQKDRFFNYLVIIDSENNIYIHKRTANDIWKGLYDFPMIETKKNIEHFEDLLLHNNILSRLLSNDDWKITKKSNIQKHILSHQKIHATFWHIHSSKELKNTLENFSKTPLKNIHEYPFPKLIENYVNSF